MIRIAAAKRKKSPNVKRINQFAGGKFTRNFWRKMIFEQQNLNADCAIEARPKTKCPTPAARTRRAGTQVEDPWETGFGGAKLAL
jgi:hypothetical protein